MSYRYLSREEMVSVTASLVDEAHADCRAIKEYHLSGVLWELIAAAHGVLLATQRLGPTPERVLEIIALLSALDIRHDDLVRGLYHALLAQEYLATDPAVREAARKLRNKMFPEGLMATRKSYRGQMGQAEMLRSRLSSEDFALLRRLGTLEGDTLAVVLEKLFQVASAMGELENERGGDDNTPTGADVQAARNQWIRAIHAFMAPLRLCDDVPDKVKAILVRIEGVAMAAGRRYQARRRPDVPAQPDTGMDPAGELPAMVAAHELDAAANTNEVMIATEAAHQADAGDATMDQPAGEPAA
jgi:hypothetical protein